MTGGKLHLQARCRSLRFPVDLSEGPGAPRREEYLPTGTAPHLQAQGRGRQRLFRVTKHTRHSDSREPSSQSPRCSNRVKCQGLGPLPSSCLSAGQGHPPVTCGSASKPRVCQPSPSRHQRASPGARRQSGAGEPSEGDW